MSGALTAMPVDSGKILVTGASGLLGANLALELADAGYEVAALYGHHAMAAPAIHAQACDLLDPAALGQQVSSLSPRLIVHCAAATNVDWCETHPGEAMQINSEAAGDLAALARRLDAAFVYISTDAVFDGREGGYRETDPIAPVNSYARSKAAGELAVLGNFPAALVLRVNIFGWNMQSKTSLAEWILTRIENGRPVPGFVDTTFSPLLVNDLASPITDLTRRGAQGVFHLASAEPCSKYDFARLVADIFGFDAGLVKKSVIGDSALSAPRPRHTWLRADKAQNFLGRPLPTIRQSVEKFRALRDHGFVERLKSAAAH